MAKARRKNLLPILFLAIFSGVVWLIIFLFIPPDNFLIRSQAWLMPLIFLGITFISAFSLGTWFFTNTRRGLLAASTVFLIMLLNYYGAGNYLTALLIVGILLSIEYYFSKQ